MAFLPGYELDIVVSFAAADDRPAAPENAVGWVTPWIEDLRWRLGQLLSGTERCAIWADSESNAESAASRADEARMRGAALLIVLHSPAYLASDRCRHVRSRFLKGAPSARSARRVDDVLLVELAGPSVLERPPELADRRGYRFWHAHGSSEFPALLRDGATRADYFEQLEELARDLTNALLERRTPEQLDTEALDDARAIYLAEVPPSLAADRDHLRRFLRQHGWSVRPEIQLPTTVDEFEAAVADQLEQCVLFVQLLDDSPPFGLSDSEEDPVALQWRVARTLERPILQWRSPSHGSNDTASRRRFLRNAAPLAMPLDQFGALALQTAQDALDRPAASPIASGTSSGRVVFVLRPREGEAEADALCRGLTELGCECLSPLTDASPDEWRQDLMANLLDCDAVLVVQGRCPDAWVKQQLREARRMTFARGRPYRAIGLYVTVAASDPPWNADWPEVQILDGRRGLAPQQLAQFVQSFAGPSR